MSILLIIIIVIVVLGENREVGVKRDLRKPANPSSGTRASSAQTLHSGAAYALGPSPNNLRILAALLLQVQVDSE